MKTYLDLTRWVKKSKENFSTSHGCWEMTSVASSSSIDWNPSGITSCFGLPSAVVLADAVIDWLVLILRLCLLSICLLWVICKGCWNLDRAATVYSDYLVDFNEVSINQNYWRKLKWWMEASDESVEWGELIARLFSVMWRWMMIECKSAILDL